MFALIEKISVATAAFLVVAWLQRKSRRRIALQNNHYGLERLIAELEHKDLAQVVSRSDDVVEVMA